MKELWNETKAVQEARESQRGLHWILEILVFIAVFFVSTFAELVIALPVQLVMTFCNKEFLQAFTKAVTEGDMTEAIEAAQEISSGYEAVIASLFATIMMIVVVILFCKFVQKRKLSSLGFIKKGAGIEYIKGGFIGFVMFSVAVLLCVATGAMKFEGISETFTVPVFLLFVVGFMIQGMSEEVLCRGYFMLSFGRRYSMIAAVVVNAVVFAALHLLNPGISVLAIVNLTLFGIFASVCFLKTENIWLIGAIHSVWNLVQGNVYGIKVSGMETSCTLLESAMIEERELINGGAFGLEGGIAVTIVLVVGIAACCLYKKNEVGGK